LSKEKRQRGTLISLRKRLSNFAYDVAIHLLNGMVYEIYFNGNGKLRTSFKTDFFDEVYEVLVSDEYEESILFIESNLVKYDNVIVHIPKSTQRLIFSVGLEKIENYYSEYAVVDIFCNGQSVFYNEEGNEKYDIDDDMPHTAVGKNGLLEVISNKIAAPLNMIEVFYDISISDEIEITAPYKFSLRWYAES